MTTASKAFRYEEAFSRNIGWVTEAEQAALRGKRIAIAGAGGVGGVHLLTLARLGVGAFNIADMDTFDLVNFNRQAGAAMSSLGRPKAHVMAAMARDINPELEIEIFEQGVNADNLHSFLSGCDAYVDGLDFFAFDIRLRTFEACAALGVPRATLNRWRHWWNEDFPATRVWQALRAQLMPIDATTVAEIDQAAAAVNQARAAALGPLSALAVSD